MSGDQDFAESVTGHRIRFPMTMENAATVAHPVDAHPAHATELTNQWQWKASVGMISANPKAIRKWLTVHPLQLEQARQEWA